MQINLTLNEVDRNMNAKYLVVAAALAVMLVAATAFATADNTFAGKYKSKSQAAAQANYCGNGELPLNVLCQNLASQIQGDGNAANIIGTQH
jgi:uncharacterized membrane protein